MKEATLELTTENEAETIDLGARLGQRLQGGEVIELVSDLGGGKTTFVKGLARGLNSEDRVGSPTFVLSKHYQGRSGLTLYHYDFYRLDNPGIMQSELAERLEDEQAIIVIEWSRIVAEVLPGARLQTHFETEGKNSRKVTLQAFGSGYVNLIEDLEVQ